MYIYSSNEIDKRINVSKIANNISTVGDNSTARLIYCLWGTKGCEGGTWRERKREPLGLGHSP